MNIEMYIAILFEVTLVLTCIMLLKSSNVLRYCRQNPTIAHVCIVWYNDCSNLNLFGKTLFKVIFVLPLCVAYLLTYGIKPIILLKHINRFMFYKR